jgi:hypothetical protein
MDQFLPASTLLSIARNGDPVLEVTNPVVRPGPKRGANLKSPTSGRQTRDHLVGQALELESAPRAAERGSGQ